MSDSHVADASKIALAARAGKAAASNMVGLFAPIANWAEILTVVAVLADLFITFVSTIFRYLFNSGLDWASDISSIAMP